MIVINSAAYVIPEFQSELGAIPPCLLPLGNKKLIQHQVEALRKFSKARIIASLPASYELAVDDRTLLRMLEVEVVLVPDGFSLAEALIYVLNIAQEGETSVRLLHGDTLIQELPDGLDLISVARSHDDYGWEVEQPSRGPDEDLVWSGFFAFASLQAFLKGLALSRGDFVKAVRHYSQSRPLVPTVCVGWFDLGHINTYFFSRSQITTQRSFNSLRIVDGVVYKSGVPAQKISAEANWFASIPLNIKKYTPQLLDMGGSVRDCYYALEYLPYLPLNELFVHGRNSVGFWRHKFSLCKRFLSDARSAVPVPQTLHEEICADAVSLYEQKTFSRLKLFEEQSQVSADRVLGFFAGNPLTLNYLAHTCVRKALSLPVFPAVLHGDLCFSNILYDSRAERIKVIDPRGLNFVDKFTIFGDQKYDVAKLAHSVVGLYDFIIAGRYTVEEDQDGFESIQFGLDGRLEAVLEEFISMHLVDEVSVLDVMPIVVLLFISMLPLHADRPDRQKAMLLNAVRIAKSFVLT